MPGGTHTGGAIPLAQRVSYFKARQLGLSVAEAARQAEISRTSGYALERAYKETGVLPPLGKVGPKPKKASGPASYPVEQTHPEDDEADFLLGPKPYEDLSPEARKALEDFGYFRQRYFGRVRSEWQVEAAHKMLELLETPDREFAVVNVAPGSGKTTLFCHDLPAWMIARDRRVRIMIGARVIGQAEKYVNRLRLTLQRSTIARPHPRALQLGTAVVPQATLLQDFGRFRGLNREAWSRDEFRVAQTAGEESTEKEATVKAFSRDSGEVLGYRPDVAIWDDLVNTETVRTPYARESLEGWWSEEAETRLERDFGGLLILQGQRLDPNDLYRYALDLKTFDEDGEPRPKYHHIVFPAHFEDRCQGLHQAGAPSYPEGCLLDSHRLPWNELKGHELTNPTRFRLVYQQEDSDPADAMVRRIYVNGGKDPITGREYPGCWDKGRNLAELPANLGTVHSVCTADPAPTRFWSLQWWLYEPESERRYLMDLERIQMTAPMLLDWRQREGKFVGFMEEWHERAKDMGVPITHWIVEHNAAQKFLFQYDHAKRWIQSRGVAVIPHQTQAVNKIDQQIGVTSIGPHYEFGRVRLPQGDGPLSNAAIASNKLVNEAVGWPTYTTTDCVMAQWFLEVNIPKLWPKVKPRQPAKRPSWMGGR